MPDGEETLPAATQPVPAPLPDALAGVVITSAAEARARSPWEIAWRRFRRHKPAMVGLIVLGILILLTVLAPLITTGSYSHVDLVNALKGPSTAHLFGTDNIGRDQFTRVLYGGRVSMVVGISVALAAGVIGTFVGALAGYHGGWLDQLLMRVTDLFLSIPFLVVLIVTVRLLSGSVFDIVLILSVFFWMPIARIVRGVFLSLKEKEFVEAARASGASNTKIIFSEILPNAVGPIIVVGTLSVAQAIITESALSFLGFGVQPPTPTWGNLLSGAQNFTTIAPWMVWAPGLFILLTVLSVNLVGDGLRDALDPHQELRAREK